MTARRTYICCDADIARQQRAFFQNEIGERKLHLAKRDREMTVGTGEGLKALRYGRGK